MAMNQEIQQLLLQRPNRNEEEFFATRILRAANVSPAEAKKGRWALAQQLLARYCVEKLRLTRPFLSAMLCKDLGAALETARFGSWDIEAYDTYVLLARFPNDRLSVFSFTDEPSTIVRRYGTPVTVHAPFDTHWLVQQPLESVLAVIEKEYRYDGDRPQE